MKGSNRTRSRGKSKRKILKSYLKQIVLNENSPKLFPFLWFILDLLDDGQVNGSLLVSVIT